MGYPWATGDALLAADLNAAIADGPYLAGGAINLAYFGAKSDGTTDDAVSLNAAIAAILALSHGGKVILPAGRTVIGSAIVANIPAGKTLTIEGMGAQASELYFSNATDGLNFTLGNSGTTWGGVHLRGFSVTRGPTSPAIANTGISLSVPVTAVIYTGASSLRDLCVQGGFGATPANQWATSILLAGCGGITVDNVTAFGSNTGATDHGDVLLSITGGPGTSQYAASFNISNCYFQGGSCGINVGGYVQGVFIANTTVIGQYDSIRWATTATYQAEEIAITNCTMNAHHRGVYLSYAGLSAISNTVTLHSALAVAAGFAGIELNNSNFNTVAGNTVIGSLTGTEVGILVSSGGANPNTIIGNIVSNISGGQGIHLQGNTSGTTVVGNSLIGATSILADTSGNTIGYNTSNAAQMPLMDVFVAGHPASDVALEVGGDAGHNRTVAFATGTTARWFVGANATAESGSSAGSDFVFVSQSDSAVLATPLTIKRSTGVASFAVSPFIGNLQNAANDSAAAAAGVQLGTLYRNGNVMMVRLT
jgi:hypothetical protein